MDQDYDYQFKIIIVGSKKVGKSSLLLKLQKDQFNKLQIDDKIVKFYGWDVAGEERFYSQRNASFKYQIADAIIMLYDINNEQSFLDIQQFWFQDVKQGTQGNTQFLILGNKCDIRQNGQVNKEVAKTFSYINNILFQEISAKTNQNINEILFELASKLIIRNQSSNKIDPNSERVQQKDQQFNTRQE